MKKPEKITDLLIDTVARAEAARKRASSSRDRIPVNISFRRDGVPQRGTAYMFSHPPWWTRAESRQQRLFARMYFAYYLGLRPEDVVVSSMVYINTRKPFSALARSAEQIAKSLRSKEFRAVLCNESIGGNAGPLNAGVNAFVDKQTGKVVQFGNYQDLPESVVSNPGNAHVIFKVRIQARPGDPPDRILEVAYNAGVDPAAKSNLEAAIKLFNGEPPALSEPDSTPALLQKLLKKTFPWLGTEEEVSGADVVQELNQLYNSLGWETHGEPQK